VAPDRWATRPAPPVAHRARCLGTVLSLHSQAHRRDGDVGGSEANPVVVAVGADPLSGSLASARRHQRSRPHGPPRARGSHSRKESHPPPGKKIDPRLTAFTRILSEASSRPSSMARWISAALVAPYCGRGAGFQPEIEAMMTTAPSPVCVICGTQARIARAAWITWSSNASRQSSGVDLTNLPPGAGPRSPPTDRPGRTWRRPRRSARSPLPPHIRH